MVSHNRHDKLCTYFNARQVTSDRNICQMGEYKCAFININKMTCFPLLYE